MKHVPKHKPNKICCNPYMSGVRSDPVNKVGLCSSQRKNPFMIEVNVFILLGLRISNDIVGLGYKATKLNKHN